MSRISFTEAMTSLLAKPTLDNLIEDISDDEEDEEEEE